MPHLRRLELRGPASDEALLSVLSSMDSSVDSGTGRADAVSKADGSGTDCIMRHLKATGEFGGGVQGRLGG